MVEPEFGLKKTTNSQRIFENQLNTNKKMREDFDFIAFLNYRTFDEGGRATPAKSGYRPQIKFDFEERTTSGRQNYLGTEWVCPGETVEAEISILSPQFFTNKLEVGMEFQFCEGWKIIGTGKILKIVNIELKKME